MAVEVLSSAQHWEKREPFFGKTILVGQPPQTNKNKRKREPLKH